MKIDSDIDRLEDDELTVTQLRKRIRMLRQKLSDKTEEQKAEEGDSAEKDREELAKLHDENKATPISDGEALPEPPKDKKPPKKDEDEGEKETTDEDD